MEAIDYEFAEIRDIQNKDGELKLILNVDSYRRESNILEIIIPANERNVEYKIGDLVKFEEEKPETLVKIPTDNIDTYEYHALTKRINSMTCEELIELHQSLKGKSCDSEEKKEDYYRYFIYQLLTTDHGYNIPKKPGREVVKFLNSKYLSDSFKNIIMETIGNNKFRKEDIEKIDTIYDALKSDRDIKEFTEEEFGAIYDALLEANDSTQYLLVSLAFKLDSEGAIKFLNNKISPISVIKDIIDTSGLSTRPEYYSGRGATRSDLSGQHLISIYEKLARLDKKKALNMVKMTMELPTLGATEFLESLYTLVRNDYRFRRNNISTNNNSFGEAEGMGRLIIGMAIIGEASNRGYRPDETMSIKRDFKWLLPHDVSILIKDINVYEDNYKEYRK